MTSQIALFNSRGVAIASDTVATATFGQTKKTITNTQKIWPIGGEHLIVVMHSGSLYMNDTTLEMFVTEWKRTLGRPLNSVQDYAISFRDWLKRESQLITQESEGYLIESTLNDHFFEIRRRIKYALADPPDFAGPAEAVQFHISAARDWLDGLDEVARVKHDILSTYSIDLEDKLNYYFGEFNAQEHFKELENQALSLLAKWQEMPDDSTLAFVGFGLSQFYSQSVRLNLRGRYADQLVCQLEDEFGARPGMNGSVSLFAQYEAIQGFLRGASPEYIDKVHSAYQSKIAELLECDDSDDRVTDAVAQAREDMQVFERQTFVDPMLDTVAALPLEGLADLAESLVGMQATRSASSAHPASVGGMIESLVIDRKDGIRWIHRLPGASTNL